MHLKTHFANYRLLFFLTWICLVGSNHGMAQTSDYSTLFSEELNESRIIQVDLPDSYATYKKEYPVLFVLDGEYIFDYAKGVTSFLSNDFGFLPETIVIGIPNTDRNRDLFVDLSPNGSYLKFIAFLEQELIPFVDQNYRTNHFRTLLGWSSGSGIANYIAVKKPQLFNAYILAGAGIGPKTEVFIQKEMDPGNYIQNFLFVSTEGTTVRAEGLKKHQTLIEQLNPTGLRWKFKIYEEANHVESMSKGLYDGLKFIFEDYLIPDSILSEGSAKVIDYYKNLKEIYGYKTRIPKGAINEISGILILQEKTEEALNLLDYGITQYPESAVLMAAKSETYAQLRQKNKAIKWCKLAIKNSRDPASINKYKILLEALQK